MMKSLLGLCAGTAAATLLFPHGASGHSLIVDVDVATPGIQTSISVLPGTFVPVDIYIVDDGTGTPVTGYGVATNFNDTPGVLAPATATIAGPVAGTVPMPIDLVSGAATAPGVALTPAGIAPFGVGPGGAFTASDGGAGYFDGSMPPFGPTVPFGLPGFMGGAAILQSLGFTAVGPIGSASDIAPLGILAGGPPPGAAPPIGGPFGVEFYDDSTGAPGGLGGYAAAPMGPFGPNPAFPAGSPGLPPITPGTIMIVPEPGIPLLTSLGLLLLARRRRG